MSDRLHSQRLTRRSLLGSLPATVFASRASVAHGAQARPNIVLFLSDDHGCFDSSVYGSRVIRTPAMQELAAGGMVFSRAFTGSPTCVPSRAIIMSGLMPARNGALPNHSGLQAGIKTLPSYLVEMGYKVAHFGKSHFQPRTNYPDLEWVPSEIKGGPLNNDLDTAAVESWLAARNSSKTSEPVCLVVCSHSPHVYWPEDEGYDPARLELPPTFVDTPETRAIRAKYYTDITLADRQLGDVYESARRHLGPDTLFLYTSDNGAQWPFAKWSLYDAGIHLPFIAAWPGVIRPGSRTNAMISFCDLLPTFMELAGARAPEKLDGRSFASVLRGKAARHRDEIYAVHSGDGNMNVYPMRCVRTEKFKYILNLHPEFEYTTHIDKAGAKDGKYYWDSWEREAKTNKAAAETVRRYHQRPAEELYDVAADPHETRNLAGEKSYRKTLENLRRRVREWMKQQGDQGKVFGTPRRYSV